MVVEFSKKFIPQRNGDKQPLKTDLTFSVTPPDEANFHVPTNFCSGKNISLYVMGKEGEQVIITFPIIPTTHYLNKYKYNVTTR